MEEGAVQVEEEAVQVEEAPPDMEGPGKENRFFNQMMHEVLCVIQIKLG